jgi:uncharacterized protein (DUF433 family)
MQQPGIYRDGETGEAIVEGTIVPVAAILRSVAEGATAEEVIRAHPGLTREGFVAALEHAARAVDRDVRYEAPAPGEGALLAREPAAAYAPRSTVAGETVVLDADEYDELLYRLDLLEDIAQGLADAAAGRTIPHDEVFDRLIAKYGG